jgi:hypothetical protein
MICVLSEMNRFKRKVSMHKTLLQIKKTESCKILMLAFGRRNVEQNTGVAANASNIVITASIKVLLQEESTE